MHTNGVLNKIDIIFQEEDRQKAGRYTDVKNCLVATALKRMGYKEVSCSAVQHEIDGFTYICTDTDAGSLCRIPEPYNINRPFYYPEVVGKQITLTLQN